MIRVSNSCFCVKGFNGCLGRAGRRTQRGRGGAREEGGGERGGDWRIRGAQNPRLKIEQDCGP